MEKGVIIILYEISRKWRIRQVRQNLTFTKGRHSNNLRGRSIEKYSNLFKKKIKF